jgi:hypothetical protein
VVGRRGPRKPAGSTRLQSTRAPGSEPPGTGFRRTGLVTTDGDGQVVLPVISGPGPAATFYTQAAMMDGGKFEFTNAVAVTLNP